MIKLELQSCIILSCKFNCIFFNSWDKIFPQTCFSFRYLGAKIYLETDFFLLFCKFFFFVFFFLGGGGGGGGVKFFYFYNFWGFYNFSFGFMFQYLGGGVVFF